MKNKVFKVSLIAVTLISIQARAGFGSFISHQTNQVNNAINSAASKLGLPLPDQIPFLFMPNADSKRYPVTALYQNFLLSGGTRVVHSFICLNGSCSSVRIDNLENRIMSPSNPFATDILTGGKVRDQVIANSSMLASRRELCKSRKIATTNTSASCYMGQYGVHGVCHQYTERAMYGYGRSMGIGFEALQRSSHSSSLTDLNGRVSFTFYGRFGIPYSGHANWTTCRLQAETECNLEMLNPFSKGPSASDFAYTFSQRAPAVNPVSIPATQNPVVVAQVGNGRGVSQVVTSGCFTTGNGTGTTTVCGASSGSGAGSR